MLQDTLKRLGNFVSHLGSLLSGVQMGETSRGTSGPEEWLTKVTQGTVMFRDLPRKW